MTGEEICCYLEWDSAFWGRSIAQATPGRLCAEQIAQIECWCNERAIDCLYLLADSDHQPTTRLAERHGFCLTDIRVTLEHALALPAAAQPANRLVRHWQEADIPALRRIASISHHDTRFYYDDAFPQGRCDELYAAWIENSCRGYADLVLVAEVAGQPSGYITAHRRASGEGQIGLLAVDAAYQAQGLGVQLAQAALGWFSAHGAPSVSVVTQGRNARAQRLYQRCGFTTRSVQLWYHRWFTLKEPETIQEKRG